MMTRENLEGSIAHVQGIVGLQKERLEAANQEWKEAQQNLARAKMRLDQAGQELTDAQSSLLKAQGAFEVLTDLRRMNPEDQCDGAPVLEVNRISDVLEQVNHTQDS